MSTKSFYRRPYRVFLSYSRRDAAVAEEVRDWLESQAGLSCFFDQHDLEGQDGLIDGLRKRIRQSQSHVLLLSAHSAQSRYVELESEAAAEEQRDRAFRIVLLLADDMPKEDIPESFSGRTYFRLRERRFDDEAAAWLLRSLYQPAPAPSAALDTFVTRSWREPESAFADQVCKFAEKEGLRLIGDMLDWPEYERERIGRIMASCGCYLAVLPYREEPNGLDFMLQELNNAGSLELPRLVVADRRLENELQRPLDPLERILYLEVGEQLSSEARIRVRNALDDLNARYKAPKSPYVVFYTTGSAALQPDARRHIEDVTHCITGSKCTFADDSPGNREEELMERMSGARAIIADVGNGDPEGWFHAGLALGAARGAGKKADLHVLAQAGAKRPRTFSFVHEYRNERDRLGLVHKLAYPYRRRILRCDA